MRRGKARRYETRKGETRQGETNTEFISLQPISCENKNFDQFGKPIAKSLP